jgi:co-chaperonin GroES (HSP10)
MPTRSTEMGNGNGIAPSSPISFIENHEAPVAQYIVEDAFEKLCGKKPPRVTGYFIAVKVHQRDPMKKIQRDDGTEVDFYKHTERTVSEDKYQSVVGLVVGVGPQAYMGLNTDGSKRFPEGPWCKVGDIVIFPRYSGAQVKFRGVPLVIFPDDQVMGIIEDPEDIIATHLDDR